MLQRMLIDLGDRLDRAREVVESGSGWQLATRVALAAAEAGASAARESAEAIAALLLQIGSDLRVALETSERPLALAALERAVLLWQIARERDQESRGLRDPNAPPAP